MILSRTFAIGLSILLRAALLLFVSTLVYKIASPSEATIFFQIVYLQAIAVAFLSASGFFRAQSLETDADAADYMGAIMILALPSLFLPAAVAVLDDDYANRIPELLIMWVGAVSTALAAPLSALTMRRKGPFAAFLPACLSASIVLGGIWIAKDRTWYDLTAYLALSGFQVLTLILLGLSARDILRLSLKNLSWRTKYMPWRFVQETIGVGSINVTIMLIAFGLRELWASATTPELAAAVFLLLRVSDTGLQLIHMVLSGYSFPILLILWRHTPYLQIFTTALSVGLLTTLSRTYDAALLSPIIFATLMQVAADITRYPWSFGFLYQMVYFKMASYFVFSLLPPIGAMAICFFPLSRGQPEGLILFLVINSFFGAAISTLQARRK